MKETQKKRMMHKKGRKCVFISKKGKTNVKAIKKPYIRNRDSYKNEEKT